MKEVQEYQWSVYWFDVFIGDFLTLEDAQAAVNGWIDECEDPSAKDAANYSILPYQEN